MDILIGCGCRQWCDSLASMRLTQAMLIRLHCICDRRNRCLTKALSDQDWSMGIADGTHHHLGPMRKCSGHQKAGGAAYSRAKQFKASPEVPARKVGVKQVEPRTGLWRIMIVQSIAGSWHTSHTRSLRFYTPPVDIWQPV